MPVEQLQRIIHTACKAARAHAAEDATDGNLLEQFLARKDDGAFAELVRRHGSMVFGVCRRVVGAHHEAEDAFQATFLVLVRKASSLVGCGQIAAWLHGVAYRTALEARGRMVRGKSRETPLADYPDRNDDASMRNEIKTIIDREVSLLPDKYRLPVILCELEGRSRSEAAQALQLTEGTLSSRLASARKALARRLSKYGFSLPATGLAVLIEQQTVAAVVPERLSTAVVTSATQALIGEGLAAVPSSVLSLADAVIRTMSVAKAKIIGVFAVIVGMIATTAFVGASTQRSSTVAALPSANSKMDDIASVPKGDAPTMTQPKVDPETVTPPAPDNNARDEAPDLKTRVKLLETDISKIRQAMLRECAIEEKKTEDAIRKANSELQEAFKRRDFDGQRKALQAITKGNNEKAQVHRVRSEIEMRIRMDDPHYEQRVGLVMSGGPGNAFGKLISGAKDRGMMIERVTRDSAAANAGLQPLDILLEVDGKAVPGSLADFRKLLAEIEPETAVEVALLRKGRKQTIKGLVIPGPKE